MSDPSQAAMGEAGGRPPQGRRAVEAIEGQEFLAIEFFLPIVGAAKRLGRRNENDFARFQPGMKVANVAIVVAGQISCSEAAAVRC